MDAIKEFDPTTSTKAVMNKQAAAGIEKQKQRMIAARE
jgi:hypothetical protein